MDTITIICSVAAEFKAPDGTKFTVGSKDLHQIMRAPAWIQSTRLFGWMAADGTLKFVTPANKIQMENAPTLGLAADGKPITADAEEKPQNTRKQAPRKKNGKKSGEEAEGASEAQNEGKDAE